MSLDGSLPDEAQIRNVLAGRDLRIVLQPVVDIRTGRTVGAEALARFAANPGIGPDQWFKQAERLGLGIPLEVAAVRAALQLLPGLPDEAHLAVNVSPRTLLARELRDALEEIAPGRVVLELTEHARVDNYRHLRDAVSYFRSRGFRLAIDDAGSGYSSLSHILELRPDVIKLDRSLVSGVDLNPVRFALASALVSFAGSLGAEICAEGIESASELIALQKLGVTLGQGYFLGRPVPPPLVPIPAGVWFVPSANVRAPVGRVPRQPASPAVLSPARLASLASSDLMNDDREESLDRLTRLAARLLGAPVALVSLVDDQRQFFKSAVGLGIRETPLTHSFCAHVVTGRSPLVVNDSKDHPLVAGNPVIDDLGVAAYAGVPIITDDGQALGSFCVIDAVPRTWSTHDVELLEDLAATVSAQIDLRRQTKRLQRQACLADMFLARDDRNVAVLDLDLTIDSANAGFCALVGRTEAELLGKPFTILKAAADLQQMFALREELLSGANGGCIEASLRFRTGAGAEVWLAVEARLVRSESEEGNLPQCIVVFATRG